MQKMIFILPNYPDVMYSFLIACAKRTDNAVKIVCLSNILQEREKIYVNDKLSEYAEIISLGKNDELKPFIEKLFLENKDAVFIFGGFLGNVGRALRIYNDLSGKRGIIITEKPSVSPTRYFNGAVRLLKLIRAKNIYKKAYKRVADSIRAVLVTGEKGVAQLNSFGIPDSKLFNFMYTHIDEQISEKTHNGGDKIRFVYVGRFNYLNRGMDSLIYTFSRLELNNWELDLVGGYGENAKEIIAWAEKTPNVNYIGAWDSNRVINNLSDYDVCVSPTRMDGWRIQVNQAIMAGIGTITTEQAISDELIKKSNSGLVVNAFRKKELSKAVTYVLKNPSVVKAWKINAEKYKERISNERIAKYFIDVIDYSLNCDGRDKPICPWL